MINGGIKMSKYEYEVEFTVNRSVVLELTDEEVCDDEVVKGRLYDYLIENPNFNKDAIMLEEVNGVD